MTDSRYVIIGTNKQTGEAEPVHPGSVTEVEAQRVKRALMELGIGVTIWDADKWEDKVNAEQADLFCDFCGAMKEDCPGHEVTVHVAGQTLWEVRPRAHSIDEAIQYAEACEDANGPLEIDNEETTDETEAVSVWMEHRDGDEELSIKSADGSWTHKTLTAAADLKCARCGKAVTLETAETIDGFGIVCNACWWNDDAPAAPAAPAAGQYSLEERVHLAMKRAVPGPWSDELKQVLAEVVSELGDGGDRVRWDADKGHFVPDEEPAPKPRPTRIDGADADDWLHLQVDGYDVFHGTRTREGVDPEYPDAPFLTDDEYQRLIDVICAALGVGDGPHS